MISKNGLLSVYESLNDKDKDTFRLAYSATYHPAYEIMMEIYYEVASGNELSSVVEANKRFNKYPMGKIDGTEMWQIGAGVRDNRDPNKIPIHPVTAGVYIATMMAQVDLLKEMGHPYSEIANESIIEAVDSLNPYMDYKGVAYMVDNCSRTARLGSRKWAPRFDYILRQQAFTALDDKDIQVDEEQFDNFVNNDIHQVLSVCAKLRPSVDISVFGQSRIVY